jgi:hypothetical protein
MKKLALIAGASMLGLATTAPAASAEDGFYIGVGVAMTDTSADADHQIVDGGPWFNATNEASIEAAAIDDLSNDGVGFSVYAGYGGHFSESLTWGIEADIGTVDGGSSSSVTGNYDALGTYTVAQSFSQDWMATVRGKLGLDLGPANAYLTAGWAFSEIEFGGTFSDTYAVLAQRIPLQGASTSETASGAVWGAGVDWGVFGGTMRLEYLHADLGSVDYSRVLQQTNLTNVDTLSGTADVETDVIRVGYAWNLF